MFRKSISAGLGFLLLTSPVFVVADTLTDLQAQIQALMAQIAALKAAGAAAAPSPAPSTSCVNLSHNMSVDDTDADAGGDVTRLQKFLALDRSIYPEGRITGYFGPATQRAVQRWQKARGIVSSGDPDSTGYGYVGPKTRAAMSCGAASSSQGGGNSTWTPGITPSIRLIAPSGGTYVAGSGAAITLQWEIANAPAGGKVCATLVRVSDNHHFAFPPENVCVPAQNGMGSMQGSLLRTSGYDLGPGSYNVVLTLFDTPRTDGKDTPAAATATSYMPVILTDQPSSSLPTPVISFSASPSMVGSVQSSTLTWGVMYANRCVMRYGATEETVGTNGTKTISPSQSTNYRLICTNDPGGGKDGPSAEKTVMVGVALPSCTLRSDKPVYSLNEKVTISWWSENATYTTFPPDTSGKDNIFRPNGEKMDTSGFYETTANVYGNPDVKLNVFNYYGQNSCTLSISVPQS